MIEYRASTYIQDPPPAPMQEGPSSILLPSAPSLRSSSILPHPLPLKQKTLISSLVFRFNMLLKFTI